MLPARTSLFPYTTLFRSCNDCMKSCIYQRQEPGDIPQIETRTLKDVLGLPWGFEIYDLLTRWNPLDLRRPLPKSERSEEHTSELQSLAYHVCRLLLDKTN